MHANDARQQTTRKINLLTILVNCNCLKNKLENKRFSSINTLSAANFVVLFIHLKLLIIIIGSPINISHERNSFNILGDFMKDKGQSNQ